MKIKLKLCPFCGGEPEVVYAPDNRTAGIECYAIRCKSCDIMIGTTKYGLTDFYRTALEAADAWNRRVYYG